MKNFPLMRNNIIREDLDKVIDYLKSDDPILTNGKKCAEFEKKWSDWLGVKYSVFVSSGSAANLISMTLLKLLYPKGGEIIVPPLTWVSDIASVIQAGFEPVFCDINNRTLGMDTEEIINKTTENTVAVFLTHVQGFNALTDQLIDFLETKKILLIEDVCESHGATFKNKRLGSFGILSNFSFYYAHHMSTIEGGMICTNDHEFYQKLRILRSHGMVREASSESIKRDYIDKYPDLNPEFIFAYTGYNFRNTEIGGIIGLSQIKRLDEMISKRSKNQKLFFNHLNTKHYRDDFDFEGSSNYAFNLILKNKDQSLMDRLLKSLQENKIEYRRGSAGGGNQLRQPYLKERFGEQFTKFPNTDHVHFYGMYIGNFPDLSEDEIEFICDVINSASV